MQNSQERFTIHPTLEAPKAVEVPQRP
jgi:hypothetical protein